MDAHYRPAFSFRGAHVASGLLFAPRTDVCDLDRIRARLLQAWESESRVYALDMEMYAIVWSSPRRVDARFAPGALIVAHSRGLTAVPPAKGDPSLQTGELLTARDGNLVIVTLERDRLVDPSEWIDVGAFELHAARHTDGSRAPELAVPAPLGSPREILDGIAEPDPSVEALRNALMRRRVPGSDRRGGEGAPNSPLTLLTAVLMSLVSSLMDVFRRGARESTQPDPPSMARHASQPGRLRRWFSRLLLTGGLSRLIGFRQATYMNRLLRMFDDGDVDAALRHAVPLSDKHSELHGFSLGLPKPRSSLEITSRATAGASLLVGGPDLVELLRQRYRAAVDRLIQLGRIDEAAFVLVELLDETEAAVSLLEREGMLRKAAEIAESRGLHPGLVIRQWFIAGDRQRAVLIARRTGAFADAIVRLDQTEPAQADGLREFWAQALADAGEYPAAVDVIWPATGSRGLAADWIRAAIDCGGAVGARMLIRRLLLEPDAADEIIEKANGLLGTTTREEAVVRTALFRALLGQVRQGALPPELRRLAANAIRADVRDGMAGLSGTAPGERERLARAAGRNILLADLPRVRPATSGPLEALELEVSAHDIGGRQARDFVLLPSGRALVAHGESGVRLLTRDGRQIKRFDVPAEHLVVADSGVRALTLAKRGERWRTSYLALDRLTARDLGDLQVDRWTDTFDGAEWLVARGTGLLVLDVLGEVPRIVWSTPDVGISGAPMLGRGDSGCFVLVGTLERWHYELPSLVLRARDPVPSTESNVLASFSTITNHGDIVRTLMDLDSNELRTELWTPKEKSLALTVDNLADVASSATHIAITEREQGATVVILLDRQGERCGRIRFAAEVSPRLRLTSEHLLVCDDLGRVLAVELSSLRLVRDFRV